jgi:cell division protein FtsB
MDSKFYRKDIHTSQFAKKILALLKNKRFVVRFVIASVVIIYVLFGSHGIIQRVRLTMQKNAMQEKILAAEKDTKRLQAESRALDGDAKAIEKVARERHGMIREGETVYKVNRK